MLNPISLIPISSAKRVTGNTNPFQLDITGTRLLAIIAVAIMGSVARKNRVVQARKYLGRSALDWAIEYVLAMPEMIPPKIKKLLAAANDSARATTPYSAGVKRSVRTLTRANVPASTATFPANTTSTSKASRLCLEEKRIFKLLLFTDWKPYFPYCVTT